MPASLVAFDFRGQRISKSAAPAATALYTDLLDDTLYAVIGSGLSTDIKPMLTASAQTAIWRSKRIVLDFQPSFAWLRLEGPVTSVVARLYGDGTLYYTTPSITNNNPVRLPAKRFREIEIELESTGRVVDVTLASSSKELAGV